MQWNMPLQWPGSMHLEHKSESTSSSNSEQGYLFQKWDPGTGIFKSPWAIIMHAKSWNHWSEISPSHPDLKYLRWARMNLLKLPAPCDWLSRSKMRPMSLCIYQVPEATWWSGHTNSDAWRCALEWVWVAGIGGQQEGTWLGFPQGGCSNSLWSLEHGYPELPQWCHQPDMMHQMAFTEHLWGAKAKPSTRFLQETEYTFTHYPPQNTWLKFISSFRGHSLRARSLEAVCQDREMDKTRASWVSLLLHRRNLAGGRTLVPSLPGETMSSPPRLSSTLPSTEKFYFNHSTLVQYSILSDSEMLQTKIGFHLSRPGNWILAGRSEFLHDIANGRQNPKQTCLQPPPVPDSIRQSVYSCLLYKC